MLDNAPAVHSPLDDSEMAAGASALFWWMCSTSREKRVPRRPLMRLGDQVIGDGAVAMSQLSASRQTRAVRPPRYLRIPEKATTLSGAWRPRDPVDDDQGGARA
jgi:hypothetical protein